MLTFQNVTDSQLPGPPTGRELSCVDQNGEEISPSSCRDGEEAGTDFLRCGRDCFIPCEGGVAVSAEDTETLRGSSKYGGRALTIKICKKLCQMTYGCLSFTFEYITPDETCTLKYGSQQAATPGTCKGETLICAFFVIVLLFHRGLHNKEDNNKREVQGSLWKNRRDHYSDHNQGDSQPCQVQGEGVRPGARGEGGALPHRLLYR